MTLVSQILHDAYRDAGIIAIDETLDADKQAEGLRVLNRLYKSLFDREFGEPLLSVNYGKAGLANYYSQDEDRSAIVNHTYFPVNRRLIFNIDESKTLFLPPNPADGARIGILDNGGNLGTNSVTLEGNGRRIETLDRILLNTNSLAREWFYRADKGNWMRVVDLVAEAESPLPEEFDDLLIILISFRINPRHGAQSSPESVEILKRIRSQFRARYRQTQEQFSEEGLYRLPSNRNYWKR